MPVGHLTYAGGGSYPAQLRGSLARLEQGLDELIDLRATMVQMIDGDTGQDASYPYLRDKFGFPDNATAKAAFLELDSLLAKLTADGEVTLVATALRQAFAKFR